MQDITDITFKAGDYDSLGVCPDGKPARLPGRGITVHTGPRWPYDQRPEFASQVLGDLGLPLVDPEGDDYGQTYFILGIAEYEAYEPHGVMVGYVARIRVADSGDPAFQAQYAHCSGKLKPTAACVATALDRWLLGDDGTGTIHWPGGLTDSAFHADRIGSPTFAVYE